MLFILLSGCGGSGDDSTPTATNQSGFPAVAGRYSLNTSTFKISCSDGSTATTPAIALNFDISQNANVITLLNTNSSSSVPGITVIDSTANTGNVQENSSFITTQIITATIDGISGKTHVNYNLTGSFTSNGWSGTYTYIVSPATSGSCTCTAPFTGTKITSAKADNISNPSYNIESNPLNTYDSFSMIGTYMATEK